MAQQSDEDGAEAKASKDDAAGGKLFPKIFELII